MQPASTMTRSPASIGASPGPACGDARRSRRRRRSSRTRRPSAPTSRKLRSIHHASSRSVRPTNRSSASASKTSSEIALARRIAVDLVLVLDRAQRLDQPATSARARRRHRRARDSSACGRFCSSKPIRRPASSSPIAGIRPRGGLHDLDALERARALRVAEVGVERRRRRRARRGAPRSSSRGRSGSGRSPGRGRTAVRDEQRLLEERARAARSGSLRASARNSSASR